MDCKDIWQLNVECGLLSGIEVVELVNVELLFSVLDIDHYDSVS
jgi:hypothetical protein